MSLSDADIIQIIKEKMTLNDFKDYVRSNGIFDNKEMPWVDFCWTVQIENIKIPLTMELLSSHFGYNGKRAFHDFDQKILSNEEFGFKKSIDVTKVGRNNIIIKKYLQSNPGIKSKVFYLLSPYCYLQCLMHANTEQSKAAHSYMAKMNVIGSRMVTSILMTSVQKRVIARNPTYREGIMCSRRFFCEPIRAY